NVGTALPRPFEQLPRRPCTEAGASHEEEERDHASDAELGRNLHGRVVRFAPPLHTAWRVVVLELTCADAGERVIGERAKPLPHHRPARFTRTREFLLVLAIVHDARHALPEAGRKEWRRTHHGSD